MANVVRVSVSLPSDLHERMIAANLSPSALLKAAVESELGNNRAPSVADRLASLEQLTAAHAKTLGQLVKATRAARKASQPA